MLLDLLTPFEGGPQDSSYLFDDYLDSVRKYKESQKVFVPGKEARPSPLLVDLLAKERVDVTPTQGMANVAAAQERLKVANASVESERVQAEQGAVAAAAA